MVGSARRRLACAVAAVCLTACCVGVVVAALAPADSEALKAGFQNPPNSARPRVWWHWMNGNVTQEGIELDLEWMQRVGIGGLQNFDAALDTPEIVPQRLVYLTPPWKDAFHYAAGLADTLGLELAIAGSPGFSESGGPWVKAEEGMKKVVWSETRIDGGRPFTGKLIHPPSSVGPFQNVPVDWSYAVFGAPPTEPVPDLYKDIAVIGYRLPAGDHTLSELHPTVTSSAGPIDAELLWDGDLTKVVPLAFGTRASPAWIELDFGHPQIVHSMTLALRGRNNGVGGPADASMVAGELEASSDGIRFHKVVTAYDWPGIQHTVTFAPVTARYFRLVLPTPPAVPVPDIMASFVPPKNIPGRTVS